MYSGIFYDLVKRFRLVGVATGIEFIITHEELERDYENIPEKRKPREWSVTCYEMVDGGSEIDSLNFVKVETCSEDLVARVQKTRVIEWPEGAELPEWPK